MRAHAARMIASVLAIVSAVILAATAVPAFAMVNGTPDQAHPEAGALYFSDTPTSARHFACSGALIDTQVFLTRRALLRRLLPGPREPAGREGDLRPDAHGIEHLLHGHDRPRPPTSTRPRPPTASTRTTSMISPLSA
jgi:hypothetical protein